MTDFYCSQKFTWLNVDLEKRSTYSCCTATPVRVDLQWLTQNPGQLFNTPLLHQERQDMLDDIAVSSCEAACWSPEKNNQVSRRLQFQSNKKTHVELTSSPETINVVVGSTCNLTCSYCCKNYSTAWTRDIAANGSYSIGTDRFTLSNLDKVIAKISHNEHELSAGYQLLSAELSTFKNVNTVHITGGEPFLYSSLIELVNSLKETKKEIIISTGLGVGYARFRTILSALEDTKNLKIVVSGENINQLYEFNRYGNKFSDFCAKLKVLAEYNIPVEFSSVLSNITLPGLLEFAQYFPDYFINYTICNDPEFLQINILDPHTKDTVLRSLDQIRMPQDFRRLLEHTIQQPHTDQQKSNLASYLQEFSQRRSITLQAFPTKFTDWLYK